MNRKRLAVILFGVAALIVVGVIGLVIAQAMLPNKPTVVATPTAVPKPTQAATPTAATSAVSPLIFGTNIGLFDQHDQVVTSQNVQDMMKQLHVQIVRMPTRSNLTDALNMQAAQAIKNVGAVPLVALRGAQNPNVPQVIADDTRMINVINQVFPDSTVYYEFGNEDDLNGVKIVDYIARWNQLVPQLKKLTPHGKWIGPVSYQYSHKNLTAFLQQANPRPDAISWHEYTCSYKSNQDKCLANLEKWPDHIKDAHQVMQDTIHSDLPVMITEWNYASDQSIQSNGKPFDDGMWNNEAFMKQWTTRAIQILVENKVFASMQYSVTNTAIPMIDNSGAMTTQGTTFQSLYEQDIKK